VERGQPEAEEELAKVKQADLVATLGGSFENVVVALGGSLERCGRDVGLDFVHQSKPSGSSKLSSIQTLVIVETLVIVAPLVITAPH
jgi:hypothetical protein